MPGTHTRDPSDIINHPSVLGDFYLQKGWAPLSIAELFHGTHSFGTTAFLIYQASLCLNSPEKGGQHVLLQLGMLSRMNKADGP